MPKNNYKRVKFMSDESDKFKVMNVYHGKNHGKSLLQTQQMAINYIEKHLGRPIEITHCDFEKINDLENRLADKEEKLEISEKVNEKLMALVQMIYTGKYSQKHIESEINKELFVIRRVKEGNRDYF